MQEFVRHDAWSSYTTAGGAPGGSPYVETIAQPEAKKWADRAAAGHKIIPTVSAGWDNRPRINDCPWGMITPHAHYPVSTHNTC